MLSWTVVTKIKFINCNIFLFSKMVNKLTTGLLGAIALASISTTTLADENNQQLESLSHSLKNSIETISYNCKKTGDCILPSAYQGQNAPNIARFRTNFLDNLFGNGHKGTGVMPNTNEKLTKPSFYNERP